MEGTKTRTSALLVLLVAGAAALSGAATPVWAAPTAVEEGGNSAQDEAALVAALVEMREQSKPAPTQPAHSDAPLEPPAAAAAAAAARRQKLKAGAEQLWGGALAKGAWEAAEGGAGRWADAAGPRGAPGAGAAASAALQRAGASSAQRGVVQPMQPLDWQWEVQHTVATRGPLSAAQHQQQAEASLQQALSSASSMARQLSRDVAEVQAAAAAAAAASSSPSPPRTAGSMPLTLWGIELSFSRNESALGFSSSPANSSAQGMFDIRAGWARSRRFVRLPGASGGVQEVAQTEVFLSISGVALVCLGTLVLLLAVGQCLVAEAGSGSDDGHDADDEEEGLRGAGEDEGATCSSIGERQRTAFIQASGYTKI